MESVLYILYFIIFLVALYITIRVGVRAIIVSLKEGFLDAKQERNKRKRTVGSGKET
jgi:hypothetical protein